MFFSLLRLRTSWFRRWMFVLAAVTPLGSHAGDSTHVAPGGPTLRITLEKGLKARRKSEYAFIAQVVSEVEQGHLPAKVVDRAFLWARKNKQPYPMPYFEESLRRQAEKFSVVLPAKAYAN